MELSGVLQRLWLVVCAVLFVIQMYRVISLCCRLCHGGVEYIARYKLRSQTWREAAVILWIVSETLMITDPYGCFNILPEHIVLLVVFSGTIALNSYSSYILYSWNNLLRSTANQLGVSLSSSLARRGFQCLMAITCVFVVVVFGTIVMGELTFGGIASYQAYLWAYGCVCITYSLMGVIWFLISSWVLAHVTTLTKQLLRSAPERMVALKTVFNRIQVGRGVACVLSLATIVTQMLLVVQTFRRISANPPTPDFAQPDTIDTPASVMLARNRHLFNLGSVRDRDIVYVYVRSILPRMSVIAVYILWFWSLPPPENSAESLPSGTLAPTDVPTGSTRHHPACLPRAWKNLPSLSPRSDAVPMGSDLALPIDHTTDTCGDSSMQTGASNEKDTFDAIASTSQSSVAPMEKAEQDGAAEESKDNANVALPSKEAVGRRHRGSGSSPSRDSSRKKCALARPPSIHLFHNLTNRADSPATEHRMVCIMVGLPARGKSYMARKLSRFLTWMGYNARSFNVGDYRRKYIGNYVAARDYFDLSSDVGMEQNRMIAKAVCEDLIDWLRHEGQVAIYDGTLVTKELRDYVHKCITEKAIAHNVNIDTTIWIESICNDQALIEANIREAKLTSPDYVNVDGSEAIADFRGRLAGLQKHYQPLDEDDRSYVKVIEVGLKLMVNKINGYLPSRICFFLFNLQLNQRPIYLTRHGESMYNLEGRVGGDSSLTDQGRKYASALAEFFKTQPATQDGQFSLWCSTLKRTIETGEVIRKEMSGVKWAKWRALSEIEVGMCDGMKYREIDEKFPDEFAARQNDKLRYRYPRGESYLDVIQRLEPVILELERCKGSTVVIAHRAVLRCMLAYFLNVHLEEVPYVEVPLHTVIKLTQKSYSCEIERIPLGIPSSDPTGTDQKLT